MTTSIHPMRVFLVGLLLLGFGLPAFAQEGLMYSVSTFKCDRSMLPDLVERLHERQQPIAQALVDEGMIMSSGVGVHQWGDEWNMIVWSAAPSMQALLDAQDEMNSRYEEAYPNAEEESDSFMNACPVHRDIFSRRRSNTTFGLGPSTPDSANTLAVSYYTCDYSKIDEIVAWEQETVQPVAQALVDEGVIGHRSLFTHEWGDEWNVSVSYSGTDLPQFLAGLQTLSERAGIRPFEDDPTPLDLYCSAHKDNIYWMVSTTSAPAE